MKYKIYRESRGETGSSEVLQRWEKKSHPKPPGILYVVLKRPEDSSVSILYERKTEAQSQRNQLRSHQD